MPDPKAAIQASIQSHVRDDTDRTALVLWLSAANQVVSPWWSEQRDKQLRQFWPTVDMLAGAVYALEAKMATIPFHVDPVDYTVRSYVDQAARFDAMIQTASEWGKGWSTFFGKWTQDLLTQDKGAFAEIIGDGPPDGPIVGMPYMICSLDAARCTRTSNPEYPVIYQAKDGRRYKLHYTRVAFASVQPSPIAEMHDTGFCALSKCLNVSQNLLDVLIYQQEKLGSRPARALMVTSGGLTPDHVKEAFTLANEAMDNQMLARYAKTVVVGGAGAPDAKLEMHDLASVPDGFNYEVQMQVGMAAIALAFGVDARELWPMTSTGATRADALIQHLKAQTKGIGHLLQIAEAAIFSKVLPPTLVGTFDYTDDAADRQAAEIKKIRSERHQIDLTLTGSVDERTVREQMLADDDLTQAQFEALELADGRLDDGTPILQLFYDPDYADMLDMGLPDPLDLTENDKASVAPIIADKRAELMKGLGVVINWRQRQQISVGLAALDALQEYYEEAKKPAPPTPPPVPAPGEAAPTETPEGEMTEEIGEEEGAEIGTEEITEGESEGLAAAAV